ncbi:hypothetical protein BTVI_158352 [Pitangus sulphuratus]|nr:hypothetical protein BTVI_158352 [Pitangus sulphuratus]
MEVNSLRKGSLLLLGNATALEEATLKIGRFLENCSPDIRGAGRKDGDDNDDDNDEDDNNNIITYHHTDDTKTII